MRPHLLSIIILSIISLFFAFPSASAQHITFESANEYKAIGVYDTWEESPFRLGLIAADSYATVTDNPDTSADEDTGIASNASSQVLAIQRSRWGSNTFGARIDLNTPLHLGTATRYVHVMIYRPEGETSSVMLIALGKRHDWPNQHSDVEQLWVKSSTTPMGGQWSDLVFPIQTNENVDLYSLVVVPDLSSPHWRTDDFIVYIDDILVDNSPALRFQRGFYPVNFEISQAPTRSDRKLTSISFNITGESSSQTVNVGAATVYNDYTRSKFISAKAGSRVTVRMAYTGGWMNGFVYVDWNNDGQFKPIIADNVPTAESELLSFTFLNDYNSRGESVGGNSVASGYITCPVFTIPADTPTGVYRMRLKVDWNSEDPGGNTDANNMLVNNGGAVVDVLLNVHEDNVRISANQLNGDVLTTAGTALSDNPIPFGKSFKIMMSPAPSFTFSGAIVRHGYGLDGPQFIKDNMQFQIDTIPATSFNDSKQTTLPAVYINGEVRIEGLFTPDPTRVVAPRAAIQNEEDSSIYSLDGRQLSALPPKGVIIKNNKKMVVK